MKQIRLFSSLAVVAIFSVVLLSNPVVSLGQINEAAEMRADDTKVTVRKGQVIHWTIEKPVETTGIVVINPTDQFGDLDFGALDADGNEVGRSSLEIEPQSRKRYTVPAEFFREDEFADIFNIKEIASLSVQVSLRPEIGNQISAASLPIAFFSQQDSRWGSDQIGTCTKKVGGRVVKLTLADAGCAVSSVAMAGANSMWNSNPGTLNSYLKGVSGGYVNGCSIDWGKAANYDGTGGFKYVSSSSSTSASTLKRLIDTGHYVVAYSKRFDHLNSTHWVVIYKYNGTGTSLSSFEYLDPIDKQYARRTAGDSWVTTASATRVFK